MRFLCIILGLAYLGAIYADSMQLFGTDLGMMASARILTVLIGLDSTELQQKNISGTYCTNPAVLYMAAIIFTEMFEIIVKSGQIQLLAPLTAFIILLFYLYQTPQIWESFLIGAGGSIACLTLLSIVAVASLGVISNTILIFCLANGFGLYFSSRFGASQRREYLIFGELKKTGRNRRFDRSLQS